MADPEGDLYDADYFLRGKQTGKSLYEDYRWLPDLTIPMAMAMVRHLGIRQAETVLDFGCARGYTVRAMRELGYAAWGYDVSKWATDNADPAAREYVISSRLDLADRRFDWVIAKDVLEHVFELRETVDGIMDMAGRGVFVVVPLSNKDDHKYVVRAFEKDATHLHRLTLASWAALFMRPGWAVDARYRVKGVKDDYAKRFKRGNGFITCRRLAD